MYALYWKSHLQKLKPAREQKFGSIPIVETVLRGAGSTSR